MGQARINRLNDQRSDYNKPDVRFTIGYLCRFGDSDGGCWPGVGQYVKDSHGRVYQQTIHGNLVRVH